MIFAYSVKYFQEVKSLKDKMRILNKKEVEIRQQITETLNITFNVSNNLIKTRCKKCKKFH